MGADRTPRPTLAAGAALAEATLETVRRALVQSRQDVQAAALDRVKRRLDPAGPAQTLTRQACAADPERMADFGAALTALLGCDEVRIRRVVVTARWPEAERRQTGDDGFEAVSLPLTGNIGKISAVRVGVAPAQDGSFEEVVEIKRMEGMSMYDPTEDFRYWIKAELDDTESKEIDIDDRGSKVQLTVGVEKLNPESIWQLRDAMVHFDGTPSPGVSIGCEGTGDTYFELNAEKLNRGETCQQTVVVKTGVFVGQEGPARSGRHDADAVVEAHYEIIPTVKEAVSPELSFSIVVAQA